VTQFHFDGDEILLRYQTKRYA